MDSSEGGVRESSEGIRLGTPASALSRFGGMDDLNNLLSGRLSSSSSYFLVRPDRKELEEKNILKGKASF